MIRNESKLEVPSSNKELNEENDFDHNLFDDDMYSDSETMFDDKHLINNTVLMDYFDQSQIQPVVTAPFVLIPTITQTQEELNTDFYNLIQSQRIHSVTVHNINDLVNLCDEFVYDGDNPESVKLWWDLIYGYKLKLFKDRFLRFPQNTDINFYINEVAHREELTRLVVFVNECAICEEVLKRINYKVNKQTFINVAAMAENNNETYITGGGSRPAVNRRVVIYEKIRDVKAIKRKIRLVEGVTLEDVQNTTEMARKRKSRSKAKL